MVVRRTLALTIVCAVLLVLILSQSPATASTPFSDVSGGHPYGDAIHSMRDAGIISGYPDGTYRPDSPVTRQQFAKMVVRTLGLPVTEADVCTFSDVPKSMPGSYVDPDDTLYPDRYVAVCAAYGITVGKTATTFAPFDPITRQQLITMVARAAGLLDPPSGFVPPFSPAQFYPEEHYQNARRAEYAGLLAGLVGVGPGSDFMAAATRGECAQLLYNLSAPATPALRTVAKGDMSGFRYGDPSFAGADMLIRDGRTWERFWAEHTAGTTPPPPLPVVDFASEMVIVALLGHQTSGGGPSIEVLRVEVEGDTLRVFVAENEAPGLLTVITNPFHIVKVNRVDAPSIVFEHVPVGYRE